MTINVTCNVQEVKQYIRSMAICAGTDISWSEKISPNCKRYDVWRMLKALPCVEIDRSGETPVIRIALEMSEDMLAAGNRIILENGRDKVFQMTWEEIEFMLTHAPVMA